MKILGIDTSCDDTAIALLRAEGSEFEILSNIVSSQVELHKKYGGVYPFLAKREHQKNLPVVFKKSLGRRKPEEIDAIAVTSGPGLEPCLWQGINFAVDLAEKLKKPLMPVNHIEAHILANFIERDLESVKMPAVCLVVSGGHTSLFLMKKIGRYQLIGETRDDAAGECFDKVARILGMGYPGGPLIAKAAAEFNGKKSSVELPRPMIHQKNYNFSFSGLKTAVLYNYKSQPSKVRKSKEYIREMAFETQEAIIDVLLYKTLKAARNFKAKTVMIGGGVAANEELRKQFKEKINSEGMSFSVPSGKFCTDNGVMIALTAYLSPKRVMDFKKLKAEGNLNI
ncbi:MAG: tRNA (adenosine(37)-N6)-threonylcarbamoyltransferase complex transferase subunit TsaD [Candidatus Paceibacterota bacterium]|jgi:N6-L-threonylcarbamoyladenine synthase|nr:tRNA (adenosine(37)-N6)-threonylcarbamoyltransferase complex transferase subunit TsaD [Candidatus Paceibacterota bacterium]